MKVRFPLGDSPALLPLPVILSPRLSESPTRQLPWPCRTGCTGRKQVVEAGGDLQCLRERRGAQASAFQEDHLGDRQELIFKCFLPRPERRGGSVPRHRPRDLGRRQSEVSIARERERERERDVSSTHETCTRAHERERERGFVCVFFLSFWLL
jgi:hypothetical protein